jgi:hypothetical protein
LFGSGPLAAGRHAMVTRRAKRPGLDGRIGEARRGDPPRTAKTRALTQVNPIRPRYTKAWVANLPEAPKPATDRMDNERLSLVGPTGVIGEGARREVDKVLGRSGAAPRSARLSNTNEESITRPGLRPEVGPANKSEEAG